MKRLIALVALATVFVGTTIAVGGVASAREGVCITAPADSPQVYVDINNDGRPEAYLGSIQHPTVCVDVSPQAAVFTPQASLCGTSCVQLTVTISPVYGVNASGYVSVSYGYDGYPANVTVPFATPFDYPAPRVICLKIGGSGAC